MLQCGRIHNMLKKAKESEKVVINQKLIKKSDIKLTEAKANPEGLPKHLPAEFTKVLAHEIVKNLTAFGKITVRPFVRQPKTTDISETKSIGEYPALLDTSALIDGRILPIINSGIVVATLLVPQFILLELQHIADSSDIVRRAKGRRGLEVLGKLKSQKASKGVVVKIISDDPNDSKEVDQKLVRVAKRLKARLITTDFNLAQVARAQKVTVLNMNDLALALRIAVVPGEEITIKITHEGKEREQGVGYLSDGTMIIVENARQYINSDCVVVITKVHQTPAGQILFGRLK